MQPEAYSTRKEIKYSSVIRDPRHKHLSALVRCDLRHKSLSPI